MNTGIAIRPPRVNYATLELGSPELPNARAAQIGALAGVGGVVGVDAGGAVVAVAEPFLDRAERCAGGGHAGAEGVAEVVEADGSEAGSAGGGLEAFADEGGVEDAAARGVAEDEIELSLVAGALEVRAELVADAVGEGDGAARAACLRGAELAAAVGAADADEAGVEVDVLPAQREQLAAPQAGHRGGQVEDVLGAAERVVGGVGEERLELGLGEVADLAGCAAGAACRPR